MKNTLTGAIDRNAQLHSADGKLAQFREYEKIKVMVNGLEEGIVLQHQGKWGRFVEFTGKEFGSGDFEESRINVNPLPELFAGQHELKSGRKTTGNRLSGDLFAGSRADQPQKSNDNKSRLF